MTLALPTQTALVLGAKGFVGRHVARALATHGVRVVGLGHGRWAPQDFADWGISQWVEGEIDSPTLDALAFAACPDAIVHCGGSSSVSFSYADPIGDYRRSVDSTAATLEWMRRLGAASSRLVLLSSAAVYGDQGDVDLTEASTRSPVSPYGFHKCVAEQLCDSYSRFFGVPVSIIRLFSVYGEGLRKQLLWDAARKFASGQASFFGTGNESRDWIHVTDAARLVCAAAFAPQARFEIFNGGNIKATTSRTLALLGSAMGHAAPPIFTGETHSGNPRRLTADYSHAQRQLAWSPIVGLESGLAAYADWYRDQSL